jgi:hypothetical protein
MKGVGNNGELYVAKANKNGVNAWRKVAPSKSATAKPKKPKAPPIKFVSHMAYVAVHDNEAKRWGFARATRFAADNALAVSRTIRKLLLKDLNFAAVPGTEKTKVRHIRKNLFAIEHPHNVEWPTFYFDEDVHNQNVKIKNRSVAIEIEPTMNRLQRLYESVYD